MSEIEKVVSEFTTSFCREWGCGFKVFAKAIYEKGVEVGFAEGRRQRLTPGVSGVLLDKFIDECCTLTPGGTVRSSVMFAHFLNWYSSRGGLEKITWTFFGRRLSTRFLKVKSNGTIFYKGVVMKF